MAMDLSRIRRFLMPDAASESGRFHEELRQVCHLGLSVIGGTEIVVAVLVFLAQLITDILTPDQPAETGVLIYRRAAQAVLVVTVGLFTIAIARTRLGRTRPAFLLCLSAWLSSAVLMISSLVLTPHASDEYISVHVVTLMLVAITVAPLRPLYTFVLGLAIWISYLGAFIAGRAWNILDLNAWDSPHVTFIFMLTLLSTGLAAVLYGQRSTSYHAQQESVRIAQDLAAAQVRALLSENAISVGKLAAALTHELNTPLGALKSSVDTMVVLAAKQATATPEAQQRLVTVQCDLRRSVNDSMERLKNVIARLQRFIDLDDTERQPTDLNELLGDVAILLKPSLKDHVSLNFDLHPLPPLTCRRQQLTTVFSSLLSNAIEAVDGDGRILVSTERVDAMVRVKVQDNGRGMEPSELETIFDPGFKVTAGRVSTGNWSLFSSRQIIFEHGGEIQISSVPGKGTTVDVLLPI
ncbi:MAG: integral rane sensor signal transduction histidine kinase [Bryobacterales bacterium]|nr:integral rane sensor signal transduction histidine kinase [Bryobacterales bacterium]